jgi:hypothetical protein
VFTHDIILCITAFCIQFDLISSANAYTVTNSRDVLEKCLHLFSYQAHAMGANAVSTIQLTNQSSSTNTVPDPAATVRSSDPRTVTGDANAKIEPLTTGPSWHLMITSGGDDQAICICNTTLRLIDTEVGDLLSCNPSLAISLISCITIFSSILLPSFVF